MVFTNWLRRVRTVGVSGSARRRRRADRRSPDRSSLGTRLEKLHTRLLLTGVTTLDPAAGSHTAPVGTDIEATFDGNIAGGTVNDQTFVVQTQSGQLLTSDGDITSLSVSDATITLDPATNFHAGELVQVTATAGIQDSGNTAIDPFVWQLRTATTDGSGTFGDSGLTLGDHRSESVTLGDVDGDGDLDAFVANSVQGNRVWLNQGGLQSGTAGVFSDSGLALGNHNSLGVSLGDVDGDGDLDAFVANQNDANRVWLNQGGAQSGTAGVFSNSGLTLGDHNSFGVSLGDVDGDGDLDAFVANYIQGNRVWLNQGGLQSGTAGVFSDSGLALGNHNSRDVSLGDVDGDGDLDAFTTNFYQPNRVWLNQGGVQGGTAGVFSDSGLRLAFQYSTAVSLGDVDGDGDLDAFVANVGQPNRVWLNQGGVQSGTTGNFSDSGLTLGNHRSYGVSLGDVDGDGDLDAFVANRDEANRVWLNQGGDQSGTAGVFSDSGLTLGNGRSQSVSLGDLDGDGDLDAFAANQILANRVWLNEPQDVDVTVTKTSSQVAVTQGSTVTYTIVVSGDASSAVTGATVTDSFSQLLIDRNITAITPTGGATSSLSTGVFSGDLTDTVSLPAGSTLTYTITATVRPSGSASQATQSVITNPVSVSVSSDFNDTDLSNNTAHDSDIVILSATSGTGFGDSGLTLGDHFSRGVSLGDVDGDGDLDAFIANYREGHRVWVNQGGAQSGTAGVFHDSGLTLGDHDSRRLALGDVDGDGDLDAFVTNSHQANRVWLNQGGLQSGTAGEFSDSGQTLGNHFSFGVSLGDVDGDGDLDSFVTNLGQANRVWLNQGGLQSGTAGVFSDSGLTLGNHDSIGVSLGDVDGDGDLDAFVASRNQPNRLWLNQGGVQSGTAGVFSDSGLTLGNHDSRSVSLGDVDGDGDLDAFVANRFFANRVWLNQGGAQSGTAGLFSDSGQSLGNHQSVDVSLGDVDGDGDLDAFVANASDHPNRVWLNQGGVQSGTAGVFSDSGLTLGDLDSRSVSLGDVDGDGDLDAFVANHGQANRVWLNRQVTVGVDGSGDLVITDLAGGDDAIVVALDPMTDEIVVRVSTDSGPLEETRIARSSITGTLEVDLGGGNDMLDLSNPGDMNLVPIPFGASIIAGAGDDRVIGSPFADQLSGGVGSDTLSGGAGNDTLSGGTDADTLLGGFGNDTLRGDAGNDRLRGNRDNDFLNGGDGDDDVAGEDGNDILHGSDGMDTLTGGEGDDQLNGGNDGDSLFGNAGSDTLDGGTGNDTLSGGTDADTLFGGWDDDTLRGDAGNDRLRGNRDNDFLNGGDGDDDVAGEDGHDILRGSDGMDNLDGGDGDDHLDGGNDADSLFGGAGSDTLFGGSGNDTLSGGTDADTLFGEAGGDTLRGEAGNDRLRGGKGNDFLNGGDDDDVLLGEDDNDILNGGDGVDDLNGGSGDDFLDGGNDADSLFGSAGSDTLLGGAGNDTLDGGTDADTLLGGFGGDTLRGSAGNDRLRGGKGNDFLNGGDDDDVLLGEDDNDILNGGDGLDTLVGGPGDDILDGVFAMDPSFFHGV